MKLAVLPPTRLAGLSGRLLLVFAGRVPFALSLASLALGLGVALPAWAQDPPAAALPEQVATAGEERPRRSLTLTVDECVELAIRQNHGLAAEWLARKIADAG